VEGIRSLSRIELKGGGGEGRENNPSPESFIPWPRAGGEERKKKLWGGKKKGEKPLPEPALLLAGSFNSEKRLPREMKERRSEKREEGRPF